MFMTVVYLAVISVFYKTEYIIIKSAVNLSVIYTISVYLTAVSMTVEHMTTLYLARVSALCWRECTRLQFSRQE